MIAEPSGLAVAIFALFVIITLGLSFYLGARAKSAAGYFAAGGSIHWFVNGIAFAGDYLSAASFLGICGMIAFFGFDGFLYSIGYLAGWIVALFVIAEPLKRMGKYTFADALDSKFHSRGIKLAAAISTLAVSIFYLIPQMVGAGTLIKPLLGLPHWAGVVSVGAVVILIVVTAGMVSTTYVQFLKGGLLVIFSTLLVGLILLFGLKVSEPKGVEVRVSDGVTKTFNPQSRLESTVSNPDLPPEERRKLAKESLLRTFGEESDGDYLLVPATGGWEGKPFVRTRLREKPEVIWTWYEQPPGEDAGKYVLVAAQTKTQYKDGRLLINGLPRGKEAGQADFWPVGHVKSLPDGQWRTGPLNPFAFVSTLADSQIVTWTREKIDDAEGSTEVYYPSVRQGSDLLRPGGSPTFKGIRSPKLFDKLNFLSLMLALFGGTASLPHILIRYYTVKDQASARKSTIVGIASIGFFYVLTLFIGLGAMTSGALDVTNNNMAAPLLARSFGEWLFAIISAIAFTTVLGTVSGLIIAASGAVAHDLASSVLRMNLTDHEKIRIAKISSVVVGVIAIALGIVFERMNVSYLVGWAFSVAASANLPSLVMLLFWKRTTKEGIAAAVTVGMVSSLAWILLSADTYKDVYGLDPATAIVPFSQPGIVTIPLGFLVLIAVSLITPPPTPAKGHA